MIKRGQFFREYLSFTKKERFGIIGLLLIVLFSLFLPGWLAPKKQTVSITGSPELIAAIDTIESRQKAKDEVDEEPVQAYQFQQTEQNDVTNKELFAFDPNTLPPAGWQKLGLKERTVITIINYRNKGGKFYQPEDLKKIWGLPEEFYQRVEKYVVIRQANKPAQPSFTVYPKRENKINTVDVNKADTSSFIALPGIGSKLAARIINFRNKLGGFYAIEQIGETYGLPDSTFQKIKAYLVVDAGAVQKLNINTATKEELKNHPYIRWNLANAIVEYRKQHGDFKTLDELKNIHAIDEPTLEKLKAYLSK